MKALCLGFQTDMPCSDFYKSLMVLILKRRGAILKKEHRKNNKRYWVKMKRSFDTV